MNVSDIPSEEIDRAVVLLRSGGLVAFPTETYYGLAVDPFNESALQRLFRVKKRPQVKPVLVLISGKGQLNILAENIPDIAIHLIDNFWPGPLTVVLPARSTMSGLLTGGTSTIGIRHSPHPVASSLLHSMGGPVTATSANRSGEPAAVSAEDVRHIFGNEVDMILDGGSTPGKLGSTLIGFEQGQVKCIREGCIPFARILNAL